MQTAAKHRQELLELIAQLDDVGVDEILDHVRWILADEDELTAEELRETEEAAERIRRGEFITLDELRRELGT